MIDYVHSIDIYSRNLEVGSMAVGAGVYMHDILVKKFTFAISSPDEFLLLYWARWTTFYHELCKKLSTDQYAVWFVDVD